LPACQNTIAEMYGFAHCRERPNQARHAQSPSDEDAACQIDRK
jgi:hypothetical protein